MEPTRREFLSTAAAASLAALPVGSVIGAMMQTTQSPATAKLTLSIADAKQRIARHIHGHFAEHLGRCIYDGIWVGPNSKIPNINGYRTDIVEALKALKIPNLRWPGGCYADDYHWRDGIGPREARPRTVNIHWGNAVEDNSFGTHEFMDLCELLECDAYVAANVGSGNPAEMRAWIEYMTLDGDTSMALERKKNGRAQPWKLPFVGIGNESWGCGGEMTAEFYVNLYNQFGAYARNFGDNRITKVASGPNVDDHHWAQVLLDNGRGLRGMSWHCYSMYKDWGHKGPALADDVESWHGMLASAKHVDDILQKANGYFDEKDKENRVGIYFDEWGTWHRTEPGDSALYQQNTIRDALVASTSLDIFHKHARRVRMANIAQTINVLQAMILTEVGGQNRMLLTPTYHVFDLYKPHMDALAIPFELECADYDMGEKKLKQVSATASTNDEKKTLTISLTNLHHEQAVTIDADLTGVVGTKVTSARMITADTLNAHNTFDKPDAVKPIDFTDAKLANGRLQLTLPARAVVTISIE